MSNILLKSIRTCTGDGFTFNNYLVLQEPTEQRPSNSFCGERYHEEALWALTWAKEMPGKTGQELNPDPE